MKQMKHWQDPVTALLGAWLILSPWAAGFTDSTVAMANFVLVGVLLVGVGVGAILMPKAWEEWSGLALGVWLIASPWLLGFAGNPPPLENALFTGLAVTILALWVLGTDDEYGGWLHRLEG